MKEWKHITEEQRKVICSGIAHQYKLKEIAEVLNIDPTSISKEVKRNRDQVSVGLDSRNCKKINRWPYVCANCSKKYGNCIYSKYKYVVSSAQIKANNNLINSRKGLDINEEDYEKIDNIIKTGVDNKKSIYQIKIENNNIIKQSISTLYRYINEGYLTIKRHNLPCACTYKKRKHNKKYDYSENKIIDRSNHTYIDYLAYIHSHPGIYVWQLDFLGAKKTDNNNILSLVLPNLQLTLLDFVNKPNSQKVVEFFNDIEDKVGLETFKELIPVLLTDRDPCFSDIIGICFSHITGEERCKIFYCDAYVSNQKPNIENINKQLRLFFPKGKSIDKYTKNDIKTINKTLLNKPLKSLDSFTPKEAFIKVFDEDLFNKILK